MEQLIRVEVSKLFGYLNHDVKLNSENGITVLHGANGSGKTTILRAIDECSRGIPTSILKIPFDKFTFSFASGRKLILRSKKKGKVQIDLYKGSRKLETFKFDSENEESVVAFRTSESVRHWISHEVAHRIIDDDEIAPGMFWRHKLPEEHEPPEWLQKFWQDFWCTLIENKDFCVSIHPKRRKKAPDSKEL